jgi:potassium-transporting ATPase potassium-binding subunit
LLPETTLSFGAHWGILISFLLLSVLVTVFYGHFLASVFDRPSNPLTAVLGWLERFLLQWGGTKQPQPMNWQAYCKALILFNLVCGLFIFIVLMLQPVLPLNPLHFGSIDPLLAFNIASGFITNTDWQSYAGEQTMSNLSQMLALTFGMVVGGVSGVSVFVAFTRGLTGRPLGNFYQDIVKLLVYVFLPVILVGSLFFIAQGVPQTLHAQVLAKTVEGTVQKIAIGPVASLLAIKQFATDGGGFFNANSAHPFENPNGLTNFIQMMLEMALPMGLIYMFGLWLNDKKQIWLIWGWMMAFLVFTVFIGYAVEQAGNPVLSHLPHVAIDSLRSATQSGGNMEGKEVRFGILSSMLYTTITTSTSTGAVNNMHDSLTPIGGLVPLMNLALNVVFGGVGVGLMNFILYGIIAVFLTGLMVGRTPEIFGKKLDKAEITLASLAILIHPLLSLTPTAISLMAPFALSSLNNPGPHGLTEILYAYTSASADNGSAFAGLNANTPWFNVTIGMVILIGRYIPIVALLGISGSLLSKKSLGQTVGSLRTNTFLFSAIWAGTVLIIGALTFAPVLVLGPVAEYLEMHAGTLF